MPLDFANTSIVDVPENLDFPVKYEDTKMEGQKYVINGNTDEYIGIVGSGFKCEDHGDFFRKVSATMTEHLSQYELLDAEVTWKDAYNNGMGIMDVRLPNVSAKIRTTRHETEVQQRIIALHGVNGTCSNVAIFGAIDFFCLNGMITGDHDKVKRKNTSGFDMDAFIRRLGKSKDNFYAKTEQMQRWAESSLVTVDVKALLESIMKNNKQAEKMFALYREEVTTRGQNLWSLYSAFTNYATYADERNGFKMRETGNDTQAKTMLDREYDVARWVNTSQFRSLVDTRFVA
jgi:hypothetical protein